jgi:hypothetical protein
MPVLGDWKAMLGSDWDKTYGASNTIYVARQNNILFSLMAQFFAPDAINDRLILIETISFATPNRTEERVDVTGESSGSLAKLDANPPMTASLIPETPLRALREWQEE